MSDKYIIKNCPNCLTYNRPKAICGLTYETGGFKGETTSYKYCKDCTDCVLKQIVELCKGSIRENERDIYRAGRMSLAVNILGKLNIQEVK